MTPPPSDSRAIPVAELDRRFSATVLDQLVGGALMAGAVALASLLDGWAARVAVILAAAVLVLTAYAVALGVTARTPGKAALRLRVVAEGTDLPIGVGRALVRTLLVALGGVPTFGFGLATLALTALADPGGQRRGWHDKVVGSVVLDARPAVVPEASAPEVRQQMVNLTAARLVPATPGGQTTPSPVPPVAARQDRTAVRASRPPARWRLTVDSGESVVIEGLALVGRVPAPRAGEQVRHLLPLASRDMTVSKTHAAIDVVDGVLVVTDRGSTNGSLLIRQGVSRELAQGRPATLLDGDRVRFGDRECTVSRET